MFEKESCIFLNELYVFFEKYIFRMFEKESCIFLNELYVFFEK